VIQVFDVTTYAQGYYKRSMLTYFYISFNVHPSEEAEYNGQLVKEGVTVAEWNEFLLQNHRFKAMVRFENGKVC
jgi:hypothetical protein